MLVDAKHQGSNKIQIREDTSKNIFLSGPDDLYAQLSDEKVVFVPSFDVSDCMKEALSLISRGLRCRTVSCTKTNAVSSRSHAILSIFIECTREDGIITKGKLNLVDLAGSERLSKSGMYMYQHTDFMVVYCQC